MYSITLSDGTVIGNLIMNGNNFVSEVPLSADIFEGKLSRVTISDGETEKEYGPMKFYETASPDGKYYFILTEISESEIKALKIRADIDYIAMMSDIEL